MATVAMATLTCSQQVSPNSQQPSVKVNVLNVCTPSAEDQKELTSSLMKVPLKLAFAKDYEVARGHSTLDENTPVPGMEKLPPGAITASDWVRVRKEFPGSMFFSNVQYSFSVDAKNMVETLVLRVRDPKDLMQIAIEDSASTIVSAASMLSTSTPVSRVKLERFGKSSVVLARCSGAEGNSVDQSAYDSIFRSASSIMERYRDALNARKMVPGELGRLSTPTSKKATATNRNNP